MFTFSTKIVVNRFPEAADTLGALATAIVDKAAQDVKAHATENTYAAERVDTSAMANGYEVHKAGSGYHKRRLIDNTQEYHIYQEMGFHARNGRWVPGAPMLFLAAEQVAPSFFDAFKRLELLR